MNTNKLKHTCCDAMSIEKVRQFYTFQHQWFDGWWRSDNNGAIGARLPQLCQETRVGFRCAFKRQCEQRTLYDVGETSAKHRLCERQQRRWHTADKQRRRRCQQQRQQRRNHRCFAFSQPQRFFFFKTNPDQNENIESFHLLPLSIDDTMIHRFQEHWQIFSPIGPWFCLLLKTNISLNEKKKNPRSYLWLS